MSRDIFGGPTDRTGHLPFMILKLIGLKPEQVSHIEKVINHDMWKEERSFFKSEAKKAYRHESEESPVAGPTILNCTRNNEHSSYTMEIRIPLYILTRYSCLASDRLFDDQEHRHLLPLSVLESLFNAAGIFPTKETAISPYDTYGELKITAPF